MSNKGFRNIAELLDKDIQLLVILRYACESVENIKDVNVI